MIDRFINLLTMLSATIIISTLTISSYDAWQFTDSWEKKWVSKPKNVFDKFDETPIDSVKNSPEQIIHAIDKARIAGDYLASRELESYLLEHFEDTGEVSIRFSLSEKKFILIAFLISLLTLIIPLSINYIKNSKFRLWNKTTEQEHVA